MPNSRQPTAAYIKFVDRAAKTMLHPATRLQAHPTKPRAAEIRPPRS